MRADDSVHFDETLRVPGGLEASHSPLTLPCRLMRVLGPVVQVPVLSVSDGRHDHSFRRSIASQLIGDHHARPPATATQQLTEKADGGVSITFGLDQNVDHGPVLVDRSP